MAQIYSINGMVPVVHPQAYVHPTAVLIGDVIIGPGVYVGPLASLRGDFGRIEMREGSNLQDTCVVHCAPEKDTIIDVDGHIGHGAIIHGCHIGRNVMVGMNAVIMDNAYIAENCIVGATAFVKAGMQVEPGKLLMGAPAKVVRDVTAKDLAWKKSATGHYQLLTVRSLETMQPVRALTEVEPNRSRLSKAVTCPEEPD
ncbi:MAG TPA: phenylacetic acid degradation protein PaaY [Burkholderiaceae bacterium]|nr:phenylacetic acid degradation protein PaaY [Burkholderiaceae bacterium]